MKLFIIISQFFLRVVNAMWGIFKSMSYGHRLQMHGGPSGLVPLDRSDLETWVTKSEEKNEKLGHKTGSKPVKNNKTSAIKHKEAKRMGHPDPNPTNGECMPPEEKGYISIDVPKVPRTTHLYWFESCCCEDDAGTLLEALYQFALLKKVANPAILKVAKRYSPNRACNVLQIDFNLLGLSALTEQDMKDIWIKYIALLAI